VGVAKEGRGTLPAPTAPAPPYGEAPPPERTVVEVGVVAAETVPVVVKVAGPVRTAAPRSVAARKMRRAVASASGPAAASTAAVAGEMP
jgi:hypothetical protein